MKSIMVTIMKSIMVTIILGITLLQAGNFHKDKEIVLAAVTQNGEALQYADPSFQKDRELVLAAVKSTSEKFTFSSLLEILNKK